MPHNGGKFLLNFNYWYLAGCYATKNLFKLTGDWTVTGTTYDQSKHDADGYVHTTYSTGVYKQCFYPPTAANGRTGNYKVKWDGIGQIYAGLNGATIIAGSITSLTAAGGSFTITPASSATAQTLLLGVVSVGTPHVTNIRFFHVDDEADVDADDYWNDKFVDDILIQAKPGVLRFLTQQDTNFGNAVTWEDCKALSHHSWVADDFKGAECYAGVSTNSGDDFSCTHPNGAFALVDKARVIVKWNSTSTGTEPRLEVSGTGMKPIVNRYGGRCSSADKPAINGTSTLVFDEDFDAWFIWGGNGSNTVDGVQAGIPIVAILDLCNRVGAHPWFCLPHLALDPPSNYVFELATFVKTWIEANAAWMVPRFETSNEIWNSFFIANGYGVGKQTIRASVWRGLWLDGESYSIGDGIVHSYGYYICNSAHTASSANDPPNAVWTQQGNFQEWEGRAASQAFQTISAVYSDDRTKYHAVVGVQQTYGRTSGNRAAFESVLTCPLYVTETGDSNDAAWRWITHIATSNYWGSSLKGLAAETTLAAEYATATAARKAEIINEYVTSEAGGVNVGMTWVNATQAGWASWPTTSGKAWAAAGLKVNNYEGAYSNCGTENVSAEIKALRVASLTATSLYWRTQQQFSYAESVGIEFPSVFQLDGNNDWTNFLPDIYAAPSQQWNGISAWSNGIKRFRLTAS